MRVVPRGVTVIVVVAALVFATSGVAFGQQPGPLARVLSTSAVRRALPPLHVVPAQSPPAASRPHPIRKGFLIGTGVGFVVGYLSMKHAVDDCPAGRSCSTAGAAVPGWMILGAGVGAFAGWLFAK